MFFRLIKTPSRCDRIKLKLYSALADLVHLPGRAAPSLDGAILAGRCLYALASFLL